MASNLDLAKRLAEFADALAQYNHLPALDYALVGVDGPVMAAPDSAADKLFGTSVIASWADVFQTPVLLDLSDMDTGMVEISTRVDFGHREVLISQRVLPSQYREFEPRLGLGEVESGEQVQVTGQQLLTAVSS